MATKATSTNGTTTTVSVDDLSKQLDQLRADLGELTKTVGTYSKEQGQAAGNRARTEAERIRARGEATAQDVQRQVEELTETAGDRVREQPLMAVGLAAGVGFLVGMLSRR